MRYLPMTREKFCSPFDKASFLRTYLHLGTPTLGEHYCSRAGRYLSWVHSEEFNVQPGKPGHMTTPMSAWRLMTLLFMRGWLRT